MMHGSVQIGCSVLKLNFVQRKTVSSVQNLISLLLPIKHNKSRFLGNLMVCM
jgi:hypothetical protein